MRRRQLEGSYLREHAGAKSPNKEKQTRRLTARFREALSNAADLHACEVSGISWREGDLGMAKNSKRRLTARFHRALSYAAELHAGQTRKGTDEPYIGHLLGVASLVLQYGGDRKSVV